ncbi:MAG: hypothetical protein V1720_18520 [bacterium]
MENQKYLELLQLYIWDELEGEEKILVENKLLESDEYRIEYENLKRIYSALQQNHNVDDAVLQSARKQLMDTIKAENEKINFFTRTLDLFSALFMPNYKYAMGSVAMVLVGLFVGYLLFAPSSPIDEEITASSKSIDLDDFDRKGIDVSNIRIENPFSMEGDIEISFDAVKPISYKGKADDQMILRLLAASLVNSENAGDRIRTINALKTQNEVEVVIDPQIKKALVTALKTDDNPAVRRETLNLLMKYPFDNEIRDAFLFVLSHDKNSGLRVAAINAFANLKLEGISIDDKIKNELNKYAEADQNNFIKLRAANMLKGDE